MGLQRSYPTYDDQQGLYVTALEGVTVTTLKQVRATGIPMYHATSGDVIGMIFQFSHRKKHGTNIASVHLHYIPIVSKNGNIAFTYSWDWLNHDIAIPNNLSNTGTVADIGLLTTDQYKLKYNVLITNLAHPGTEAYSDILLVKVVAAAPAGGTNWWTTGNEIAIAYMDAHYVIDRNGSLNELTD
jgi:hypothetical protein